MIPDLETMTLIAQRLETEADKRGWDVDEPLLGFVTTSEEDETYQVFSSPLQPAQASADPDLVTCLRQVGGIILREAPEHGERVKGFADAVCGIWLIAEAWVRFREEDAERQESRLVFLLDCAGRTYVVNRAKGGERLTEMFPAGRLRELSGDTAVGVVGALRDILLPLVAFSADGAVDITALARVTAE